MINLVQLSKTMAFALRHHPERFGLFLDDEGWVPVEDLLLALRNHQSDWQQLRAEDFAAVIAQSEKQRYEMRDGMIRAYYGHSIPQRIERKPAVPPEVLFHGTTPQAASHIRIEGLKPMRRQHVHLSEDSDTARLVALRRTQQPVILRVRAREAYTQGIQFYSGNDKVWLAEPVPPVFIEQI
jgi:putative RNA 2'-phosphotransferase